MNPTQPLSPFLKSLVDRQIISPIVAEQFNQLESPELQQQAVAAWPEAIQRAAQEVREHIQYPRGKVLYQRKIETVSEPPISRQEPKVQNESSFVGLRRQIRTAWRAGDRITAVKYSVMGFFVILFSFSIALLMMAILFGLPLWILKVGVVAVYNWIIR